MTWMGQRQNPADPGPIAVGPVMQQGGVGYTGGTVITMGGADQAALENLVAMQEMFLDSEMRRTYGKPPKPVFPEYCTCGKESTGTAEQNRQALDAHHASGECPHTPEGRHLKGFEVG
jgi:hypothetical protein